MNKFIKNSSSDLFLLRKFKNGIVNSFGFGFCLGLLPNKIHLKINNDKSYNNIPLPLICGCLGTITFISSPLLLINYIVSGNFFDKLYDVLVYEYDIKINRHHQYGIKNDKYDYPSIIIVTIDKNNH